MKEHHIHSRDETESVDPYGWQRVNAKRLPDDTWIIELPVGKGVFLRLNLSTPMKIWVGVDLNIDN